MDKMAIYNRLPVFAQNCACTIGGARIAKIRFGKGFWEWLNLYERLAKCSIDERCEYRNRELRKIITYCYASVPYYRHLFDEGGINPQRIKTLEDLSAIPITTKADYWKNPAAFKSEKYNGPTVFQHTSGSTGSSMLFNSSISAVQAQWACWWRYRRALGIEFGTASATMGSKLIVPKSQTTPPYWRTDAVRKQVYFSGYHEKENTLGLYCEEIKRRNLTWVQAYPSLIAPLASHMIKHGIRLPSVKFVTLSAENLLDHQRSMIEEAFGVQPRQHYGMTEGTANFSEDTEGKMYVDEEFAAVEFLPLERGGYQVIGTTLTDYATPFIRWNVGDVADYIIENDGRRRIVSLDGRLDDCVVTKDGTKIGRLSHVFKDTTTFVETQIFQGYDYGITVFVVSNGESGTEDERLALRNLRNCLGNEMPITFKYVSKIPRPEGGKLRAVVSRVSQHDNGNI